MDFKLNFLQHPTVEVAKREIARYMIFARTGLGITLPGIKKICERNHVANISTTVWKFETNDLNITMPNFWTACAVYHIEMSVFNKEGELGLCVKPSFENNYPVILKKLGDMLAAARNKKGVSVATVARDTGLGWETVRCIEQGTRIVRLKGVLLLMAFYGFTVDFKQTNI